MLLPDALPAVPFVDRILFTAFDVHTLAGVAVVAGCLILLTPAVGALRRGPERPVLLAFGASWAALIAAAALGNYPTPLVGYGGSAVLGYLLSVALLTGSRSYAEQAGAGGTKPQPVPSFDSKPVESSSAGHRGGLT
jgi:hypothetical protein